jgi:hypothetical protein
MKKRHMWSYLCVLQTWNACETSPTQYDLILLINFRCYNPHPRKRRKEKDIYVSSSPKFIWSYGSIQHTFVLLRWRAPCTPIAILSLLIFYYSLNGLVHSIFHKIWVLRTMDFNYLLEIEFLFLSQFQLIVWQFFRLNSILVV